MPEYEYTHIFTTRLLETAMNFKIMVKTFAWALSHRKLQYGRRDPKDFLTFECPRKILELWHKILEMGTFKVNLPKLD